ncbi:Uncharacterised protein [Chlamydia abortus]|nr:Uncharacterised protein [Chlamydia abortus]SGA31181.1 Uncharacterised protein [Chlamydia abortus]SGA33507.1 Uncharacterised protein [Chlamydia abortus]
MCLLSLDLNLSSAMPQSNDILVIDKSSKPLSKKLFISSFSIALFVKKSGLFKKYSFIQEPNFDMQKK